MAYNERPDAQWPGYSFADGIITIPLASMGITAEQADPWSGDWRPIIVELGNALWARQQAAALADRSAVLVTHAAVEKVVLGVDSISRAIVIDNTKLTPTLLPEI